MRSLPKVIIVLLIALDIFLVGWILLSGVSIPLLQPKGIIAVEQRNLLGFATLLSAIALIPVFIMTFFIAYHYRDGNTKAKYTPSWGTNTKLQILWWMIPTIIILILGIVMIKSTHALDPFKPLESKTKPLTIQVVALQWKWLFIYPEYNIATVNFIAFPEKTPITFELTADAPMNSFWIPHLGGQLYAMEGMVNKTHLMAQEVGEFPGASAEISGEGFAGMKFIAKSTTQKDFDAWVTSIKNSPETLTLATYTKLAKPSENTPRIYFSSVEKDLFNGIVMKFMTPSGTANHETGHTAGMH